MFEQSYFVVLFKKNEYLANSSFSKSNYKQLYSYMNNVLSENQLGFRSYCLAVLVALCFLGDLTRQMDNGKIPSKSK